MTELANKLMSAESPEAFLRENGPLEWQLFSALKSEVDRLVTCDLNKAGRLTDRVEELAGLVGDPVSKAFARGSRARVEVEADGEELRVEGQGLVSGTSYQIVVDTLPIGSAIAQSGYLKVKFTSDGSSGVLLPPELRPANNINRIELRNPAGQIVLQGVFRTRI